MRYAPAVVALLLVLVPLAGAVAPSSGGPADRGALPDRSASPGTPTSTGQSDDLQETVATNHTPTRTRILSIPAENVSRTGADAVTIEVGTATTLGGNVSTIRIETSAIGERVVAAETADQRRNRILTALETTEDRADALYARQQRAITAYSAGEIDERQLLFRLAELRLEARALQDRVRVIRRLADATPEFNLSQSRTQGLLFELRSFGGPVTDRIAAAVRGEGPLRVYVETGPESVVLATVAGDTYVREVYRGDLRTRDGRTLDPEEAGNITAASYPEIWRLGGSTANGVGSGGTFVYDVTWSNGSLTAFVDGGSDRVFKEFQRLPLSNLSLGPEVRRNQDQLVLRVNRTYPGGPLRVRLENAETGDPVDAVVRIGPPGGDSRRVGRTGSDGVLWTIAPRGEFQVTAVEPESARVARVSADPLDPPAVNESIGDESAAPTAEGS